VLLNCVQSGFSNWNRRDFNAFVKAAEKYGRTALTDISAEVDGKSEEDVSAFFFQAMWCSSYVACLASCPIWLSKLPLCMVSCIHDVRAQHVCS
jgi:hypothetical protein